MTDEIKIGALEARLNALSTRNKNNQGVCRRINREIRNLQKKIDGKEQEKNESTKVFQTVLLVCENLYFFANDSIEYKKEAKIE